MKVFETGVDTLHFLIAFNIIVVIILGAYIISAIRHHDLRSSMIFVVLFVGYCFMIIAFANWNQIEGINDPIVFSNNPVMRN
ncbi:uncharacterized membrane protein YidH (DUF202 family) [Weissella uvarum]|uniref:hypothetical protein n=1 Tax=Weissella uvarum TaxID=1479233 RepID=UPI0019606F06|nr:hypothetical protein [Weissella uvarum]MBM7617072.1 uncharacterized membrane protein YidH (DUF202 family) [Weissella uvarum]MCM0595370.1 hypothetical protein [Weissella uvarum]